ncbi:MAG: metallophosphoesterase [Planctomycetota bacterium]
MLDPHALPLPRLPDALVGLRIAHVSDLHLHRREQDGVRRRFRTLIEELHAEHIRRPIDLLVLTGDYMNRAKDEPAALKYLAELHDRIEPAVATLGVFGNHDSDALVEACIEAAEEAVGTGRRRINWLRDAAVRLTFRGTPVDVLGLDTRMSRWPDAVRLVRGMHEELPTTEHPAVHGPNDADRPFRLMLAHIPRVLPTAADLGVDLLLSGHTHGGQMCLPGRTPLRNSSSLPLRLTTGWQRHRDTLACVSRGLGEMTLPCRMFAPRQLPIYTLTQGQLPPLEEDRPSHLRTELAKPW